MRKIEEIIIHCTATPEGRDVTVEELKRWHKARGFSDVGYHYVIALDGEVKAGRREETMGAHCSGRNAHSIGVCYVGGLDKSGKPKDTRTEAQKASMAELVRQLCARYSLDIQKDVHGHREYAAKACPSFDVREWVKGLPASGYKPEAGKPAAKPQGTVARGTCAGGHSGKTEN